MAYGHVCNTRATTSILEISFCAKISSLVWVLCEFVSYGGISMGSRPATNKIYASFRYFKQRKRQICQRVFLYSSHSTLSPFPLTFSIFLSQESFFFNVQFIGQSRIFNIKIALCGYLYQYLFSIRGKPTIIICRSNPHHSINRVSKLLQG